MFIKIVKRINNNIEVWLMKDVNHGVRIYFFSSPHTAAEPIKALLGVLKDFPVVCLEKVITDYPTDIESILM